MHPEDSTFSPSGERELCFPYRNSLRKGNPFFQIILLFSEQWKHHILARISACFTDVIERPVVLLSVLQTLLVHNDLNKKSEFHVIVRVYVFTEVRARHWGDAPFISFTTGICSLAGKGLGRAIGSLVRLHLSPSLSLTLNWREKAECSDPKEGFDTLEVNYSS